MPDAWDDDWTNVADEKKPELPAPKLSKAEKRAQHQQLQKDLWASAENPSRNLWLEAKGATAVKQDFVPSMTVLSRKPAALAKRNPNDPSACDEDDSEEERRKKRDADLEERQRKAKLEREEKVRRYAEARERIMGSSAPASPKHDSRESSQGRNDRGKQRHTGAARGGSVAETQHQQRGQQHQSGSSTPTGQLFDPEDMTRRLPKKSNTRADGTATPRQGDTIRQPRGPDGSGGFGFGCDQSGRGMS